MNSAEDFLRELEQQETDRGFYEPPLVGTITWDGTTATVVLDDNFVALFYPVNNNATTPAAPAKA